MTDAEKRLHVFSPEEHPSFGGFVFGLAAMLSNFKTLSLFRGSAA
jgi:hypothetical protein